MKHLLTSAAMVVALACASPVWAQGAAQPGGGNPAGNAVGMPGPNPGGPGLTPYSTGAQQRTTQGAPQSTAPAPAAPSGTPPSSGYTPPSSGYESTSATPPSYHRHARHTYHGKTAYHHRGGRYPVTGDTANQLNQEELARLQAGNYSSPSAPSYSGSPPPSYSGSPPPSYSGSPPPSYPSSSPMPPSSYPSSSATPRPPGLAPQGGSSGAGPR